MMNGTYRTILLCLVCVLLLPFAAGCAGTGTEEGLLLDTAGETWTMGFGSTEIGIPADEQLYLAGYHNGWEIGDVLDAQRANALWLDAGGNGILWISVDCVGLLRGTVNEIRRALDAFCRETGCAAVNVCSTHDHAGIDTMGLWGPAAQNGKNEVYMENLVRAAADAAKKAYEDRTTGRLFYGTADTGNLQRDSRAPYEYDNTLYQLRFVPDNGGNGIRILNYQAHAESLRGDNRLVSRDYPGDVSDRIGAETGDRVFFTQGAIGGLIMTEVQTPAEEPFDAVKNMRATGERLASYALSVGEKDERELSPSLSLARVTLDVPLDNTMFLYYKFLGILSTEAVPYRESATGYAIESELSILRMGDVTFAMIPGELYPELKSGVGLHPENGDPEALDTIAARYGADTFLVCGLANDEVGYIVTPSDFRVNETLPYVLRSEDEHGEDHYEETNSAGPMTAAVIADALERAFAAFGNERRKNT